MMMRTSDCRSDEHHRPDQLVARGTRYKHLKHLMSAFRACGIGQPLNATLEVGILGEILSGPFRVAKPLLIDSTERVG